MRDPDFISVPVASDDLITRDVNNAGQTTKPGPKHRNLRSRAKRRAQAGTFTPTKAAALKVFADAVAKKQDTVEQLLATMNRAQRRQFAAEARAHAKRKARIALESARHHARRAIELAEAHAASATAAAKAA